MAQSVRERFSPHDNFQYPSMQSLHRYRCKGLSAYNKKSMYWLTTILFTNKQRNDKILHSMPDVELYHLIATPMSDEQAAAYKPTAESIGSQHVPLGGQSGGIFFFTTYAGAANHAEFIQENQGLTTESNKNIYVVRAKSKNADIKYPVWQLDYEATRDYFFDLFLARANISPIKFDDVKVSAVNGGLQIQDGKKFMRLRKFMPEHSGLIEKIVGHLYTKEKSFQDKYDDLLQTVVIGADQDTRHFAVKTTKCPVNLSVEKIENTIKPIQSSQIDKWNQRYRRL